MSDLKAVFFDVAGTLWDKAACDRQVMDIVLPMFMARLPEDDPEQIVRRFNAALFELPCRDHLRERRSSLRRRRFEAMVDSYGLPTRGLAREMNRTYDTTRRLTMRQFLRRGALRLLSELGRLGLRRGVIMNGAPAVQRHLLETLGLKPHVDHAVLAEVEGFTKPDVRLFRRAVELVGIEPTQMLYVGDSPMTDILGAARAGIPTVWFRTGHRRLPADFPAPDFTITDLSEILPIVAA